jgi:hypothetical protein
MFKAAKSLLVALGGPKTSIRQMSAGSTFSPDDRLAKKPVLNPPSPPEEPGTETRAAKRFVPRRTATSLTTTTGKKLDARIINVSSLAVALEADFSNIGADPIVTVGLRPVRQGRRIMRGMVFLFEKPLDPSLCRPELIL